MRRVLGLAAIVTLAALVVAQQHDPAQHAAHQRDLNARGEQAMGFSQAVTTHHFILLSGGGYIQATANKKDDNKSVEGIRTHLFDIKKKFAAGDFSAPELTHAQVLPGTPKMQELRSDIAYSVELIEGGGRLKMTTRSKEGIAAIHEFLKFQIEEHATGDPTEVQKK
jgi:hypothetical protein